MVDEGRGDQCLSVDRNIKKTVYYKMTGLSLSAVLYSMATATDCPSQPILSNNLNE